MFFVKLNDDKRLTSFYFILLTRFVLCIKFRTYKSTKLVSQKILICNKLRSNQYLTQINIRLIYIFFDTTRSFVFLNSRTRSTNNFFLNYFFRYIIFYSIILLIIFIFDKLSNFCCKHDKSKFDYINIWQSIYVSIILET